MSGKHADGRTPRPSRKIPVPPPLFAAVAVAAVLIGTAVWSLRLGPATTVADTAIAPPTGVTGPTQGPSPTEGRPEDRADRSELRQAASPAPTTTAPKPPRQQPPPGSGPVTSTGTCKASFYSDGQRTANGEYFDPNAFTAAHKTLPFNTRVRVTNLANGKSTVVRINDRGPFVASRCLDLSRASFAAIASLSSGVANVRYEVLG
jgi:peptidoglycan lytic transglycosylase